MGCKPDFLYNTDTKSLEVFFDGKIVYFTERSSHNFMVINDFLYFNSNVLQISGKSCCQFLNGFYWLLVVTYFQFQAHNNL
jgi:hypothetical protein